jgi:hypothetical protein
MNSPFLRAPCGAPLAARRAVLRAGLAGLIAAAPLAATAQAADSRPLVEVWKDPSCGCCQAWVAHLQAQGFRTRLHDTGNQAVRARLGLPERYGSCHTAQVAGYVIEGHVPAADIHRLLKQRPAALGLAVPGMPVGSPGMDDPAYGGRRDPYDVLLVATDGSATTFQSHR